MLVVAIEACKDGPMEFVERLITADGDTPPDSFGPLQGDLEETDGQWSTLRHSNTEILKSRRDAADPFQT